MRFDHRRTAWLHRALIALVAGATIVGSVSFAADNSKIRVVEAKWGDFFTENATCAPDLSRCNGQTKCVVPPKDYQCKTAVKPKPVEIQLNIVWECGDSMHAAGHGAGPGTGQARVHADVSVCQGREPLVGGGDRG